MKKRRKPNKDTITVKFKKLGKMKPDGKPEGTPFGTCNKQTGSITIDPRQDADEMMDTIIHEVLHYTYPFLEEDTILVGGSAISSLLWKLGYRPR
jgi:hypothetical protein